MTVFNFVDPPINTMDQVSVDKRECYYELTCCCTLRLIPSYLYVGGFICTRVGPTSTYCYCYRSTSHMHGFRIFHCLLEHAGNLIVHSSLRSTCDTYLIHEYVWIVPRVWTVERERESELPLFATYVCFNFFF